MNPAREHLRRLQRELAERKMPALGVPIYSTRAGWEATGIVSAVGPGWVMVRWEYGGEFDHARSWPSSFLSLERSPTDSRGPEPDSERL